MTAHQSPASAAPDASAAPNSQKTMGELVANVSQQLSRLVRGELELAQVRLTEKVSALGGGGAMLAVAGVLALYALGLLFLGAVWAFSLVLPLWASFLIVAGILLVIVAILALVGKSKIDASKKVQVDPASGFKADVAAAKKGISK